MPSTVLVSLLNSSCVSTIHPVVQPKVVLLRLLCMGMMNVRRKESFPGVYLMLCIYFYADSHMFKLTVSAPEQ